MVERVKHYAVGYRKPPRRTRFKPGESGNPKGRPKGAKNFATVIAQELNGQVPVMENGKRKRISKRAAIVKQVINQAASGDLKAAQTVFNEARLHEGADPAGAMFTAFDTPERQLVLENIIKRLRLMAEVPAPVPDTGTEDNSPEDLLSTEDDETP